MILRCDVRRLANDQTATLLTDLAMDDMARSLIAQGYKLGPVRGPGRPRKGRISIRLTWTRWCEDECQVIRITHSAKATPAE